MSLPSDVEAWRAVTLWQPWATLTALGVKTVETRGRRCYWSGWTMIHAAKRRPSLDDMRVVVDNVDAWKAWRRAGLAPGGAVSCGPLGAVVAVARFTDCLPIVAEDDDLSHPEPVIEIRPSGVNRGLWLHPADDDPADVDPEDVSDQLPYGNFRPGRFGLLLADVHPLVEPVAAKGQQAVPWRPSQGLVDAVLGQVR